MCGIAGIFDAREPSNLDAGLLKQMTDALVHRGPDESGFFIEPGIGLGHRRLSIIDLSSGQQPMTSADGSIVVSYNGEIYNYQEIRSILIECGYHFRTNSDTEVILYAWMEWGENCVQHFRGMFAFALYDKRTQVLFLARDRLGVKPLYYSVLPGNILIFGSELKALLVHPALRRDHDLISVENYFAYGYIPEPRTIFQSVQKLPAGYTITIRRGRSIGQPQQYWDLNFHETHKGSVEALGAELIDRMREAVKIRLVSEVPLGAFLSGGVDSSAVVALMAGLSTEPVNTCSIGFREAGFDESSYADRIAQKYHTRHHQRIVDADDFHLIDQLVAAYDEPFADASALPTFRVCQLARETVTVALSGDGGDEMLAGYRRHRFFLNEENVRSVLPLSMRRPLFGLLGRLYPKMDWAPRALRAKSTFQSLGLSSSEAYFNAVAVLGDDQRSQLFSDNFKQQLQGYRASELYCSAMENAPAEDALSRAQYADIKVWLPGDILTKMDRVSMAVSLEAREPLLDHKLMEWAAGLPIDMRIRGGQGKWLFKKALEPHIPHDILYRPKMGFVVPIERWFRGPLANRITSILDSSSTLNSGWFNVDFIRRAINDHVGGARNNSRLLWQLIMLDASLKRLSNMPTAATVS